MPEIQLAEAIKYYNVKNYKDAYPILKKLSRTQTEAAYYFGLMHFYGQGTNTDYQQAFKLFKKAWEGLYPDAIYMLGVCYEEAKGVEKDLSQAFELYQAAAKNESELAILKIAKFYEEGNVVEKSLKTAIELYVKLSKFNNAYAMYRIGTFYLEGKGLKKSLDNAYMWLNKALAAGSMEAMNYFRLLGSKSKSDIRSTKELYQAGVSLLEKGEYEAGIQMLDIAAKEKYLEAVFRLAKCHLEGTGVPKSEESAFKILLKYKDIDNPELYLKIGKCYEEGKGIGSSYVKAALFYELAAKKEYEPAKTALLEIRGY